MHLRSRTAPDPESPDDGDGDSTVLLHERSRSSARSAEQPRSCWAIGMCVMALAAAGLLAHSVLREWTDAGELRVVTWNIAAINNNPFEYWITHDDADYNKLMEDVQDFISSPGERDVEVGSVFSASMWAELKALMVARGWEGVEQVDERWRTDFSRRKIISGFMKDKALGDKRLASMPDRITNTINLASGGAANRPTVINCFAGDMTSLDKWWHEWKNFMFTRPLKLPSGELVPAAMLSRIKRSKYPALTEAEEAISIPLQTLAQAIFDATLVHIVNSVSAGGKWQRLQQSICKSLNQRKDERTLGILASTYSDASIVFLQESAGVFVNKAEEHTEISNRYMVARLGAPDTKRDQNSVILLRRAYFREETLLEHTASVMRTFDKSVPVATGDLLVIAVEDNLGRKYLLASFHGDTNGLATIRVWRAVKAFASTFPEHQLVFGMDANTHTIGTSSKQGVTEFATAFVADGYTSCWGDAPDPNSPTTFNARTYLQPQLQKAARTDEKESKGDKNPKDFILFPRAGFRILRAAKDNTGEGKYVEGMVFPTLRFPSDHGIVSATLKVL